ncbi:MAG: LPS export ABC transporter permease LptG, partial [Thermodesulfobacteria bacterium]|nr:LPS export ABC transporter permease LptG [Thermodesulfobacteriota bacterium]
VVGLGFYFFDQMSMQLGLLWNIKPVIIAFLPVVVAAAWAFVQVRKVL